MNEPHTENDPPADEMDQHKGVKDTEAPNVSNFDFNQDSKLKMTNQPASFGRSVVMADEET